MTLLLTSIAAAGGPSAGLVVIFIVLEAVNLTGPQVELIVGAMLAIELSARHVSHSGQCVQRFLWGGDYCAPGGGKRHGHVRCSRVSRLGATSYSVASSI